jgi:hypothetical protein
VFFIKKIFLFIFICSILIINTGVANASPKISKTEIKQAIYKKFGTGWLGREMVCIANRESHLNPKAINWNDRHPTSEGTFKGSFGLFQIGALHAQHSRGTARNLTGGNQYKLLDPYVNIQAAYHLYMAGRKVGQSGLGPWGGGC